MRTVRWIAAIAIVVALVTGCSGGASHEQHDECGDDDSAPHTDTQPADLYSKPEIFGWILLEDDMDRVLEYIDLAQDYGINAIQLSHDIVMDIDEIIEEPYKADFINEATEAAHEAGIKVYIWTHELNNVPPVVCFDPQAPVWEERRNVYRRALAAVPDVDGVVVSFGSASPEPWWAPCFCEYCLNLPPTGNPILDAIHSHPVDRIHLLFDILHQVVVGEFGKELVIRTFIHLPAELEWMIEALHTSPVSELTVMSKCVPQDWEPYYPHNPVICDNGGFDQVVEFDLAGEYWGRSAFPFALPGYLKYRLEHELRCGIKGAFGRVERGSDSVLGTPNEINLYAYSELLRDITKSTEEIWREWVELRYGVDAESEQGEALIRALERTFDIGRKMYYAKGFWLEKGSDVPDNLADVNTMLVMRSLANWDEDYAAWDAEMKNPTKKTLSDIAQEKHEAIELAERSLADLELAKDALSAEDYEDLKRRLTLLRDCALVWNHAHQAIFRWKYVERTGDPQEKLYLEWNLDELARLADYMEATYGAGVSPGNPGRIRSLVEDIRERFGDAGEGVPFEQMVIENIRACEVGTDYAVICWETSEPSGSVVEYGLEVPDYGSFAGDPNERVVSHEVRLDGLSPRTRYVFRVHSQTEDGTVITSGDYSFRTE